MSRLLLARHGQSVSNAVRRFQGVQDVALSELGARQAEALGRAIRRLPIAAVYTSPLERARRTAEIAAAGLGVPLQPVDDLRELSLGDWEGRTVEEIRALPGDPYEQWVRDPVACPPPGAEPLPEVQARVVGAMAGIAANEADEQSAITEAASITAPTAVTYDVANEKNVVQIIQRADQVTYKAQTDVNRLKFAESGTSGYAYGSDPLKAAVADKLAFQTTMAQTSALREFEKSALYGTYAISTSGGVANKMRGIITACTTNTVAASSASLAKSHFDTLLLTMAGNGAFFQRGVIFANAFQKQMISKLYEFVPADRNKGGSNIQVIETDFGTFEVVFDRHMPTDKILVADMAYCHAVKAPVPGKSYLPGGLWLLEELGKAGAADKFQLYGQVSIDYGSEKCHGTITGLATS